MHIRSTILTGILLFIVVQPVFSEEDISPRLKTWATTGDYIDFKTHRVFYHDSKGSNENVILLMHGFPTSSWDWRYLIESLSPNYRLISMDMLGFGFSDKPSEHDYSIEEQADLQHQLLKTLGINQVHIISHDYGSYVAQEMLTRFNKGEESHTLKIKSLVMLNGPVIPEHIQLRFIQKVFNSPFGWLASQFVNSYLFEKNFRPIFGKNTKPSDQALRDDWYVISQQEGEKLNHKLIHYYDESIENRERWLGAIKNTSVPVMSISGLADPVAGESMVQHYAELFPNLTVSPLQDIGHYPHVEAPESVVRMYRSFLASTNNSHSIPVEDRSNSRHSIEAHKGVHSDDI